MSNRNNQTRAPSGRNANAATRYDGATTAPKPFDTYTDFAKYIVDRKCPKCSSVLIQSASQVDYLFRSWISNKGAPLIHIDTKKCEHFTDMPRAPINSKVKCRSCTHTTCIACFDKEAAKTQSHTTEGAELSWCCSRGRLFTIWALLCGFDTKYCQSKKEDAAKGEAARSQSHRFGTRDKGTGYVSTVRSSVYDNIYGGFSFADAHPTGTSDKDKARSSSAEQRADRFHQLVFALLGTLLPCPDAKSTNTSFDDKPPAALASCLLNSKILDKAAELLRDDSLEDATKRKDVYMAPVKFLRACGTHEALKDKVLYGERIVWPDTTNLSVLSFQSPSSQRSSKGSSFASGLRNLNTQSEIMLRGAISAKHELKDKNGQHLLWLCRLISDICSHLGIKGEEGKGHGIVEVADEKLRERYAFAREAMRGGDGRKGRVKRLITEVTTLKTGLAEGIWVKHAISRLDCMK